MPPRLLAGLAEAFPEIDIDPKRLFIHRVLKTLDSLPSNLSAKSAQYVGKIRDAMKDNSSVYNAVHMVLQEMADDMKKGWASMFKDEMTSLRKEIIEHMNTFLREKKQYQQLAASSQHASDSSAAASSPSAMPR